MTTEIVDDVGSASIAIGQLNLDKARSETLRLILDYMPSGVSLFDRDLQMIACNEKLKTLLDFPEELFADGLPSLESLLRFNAERGEYGPGDPEELTSVAMDRACEKQPHIFERTRPNGLVLEIRGTPLPSGGFVSTYSDICTRKQAENALHNREEEMRLLVDNVPAMILSVDRSMHCTFANKRYADFFGFLRKELVGKTLNEIIGDIAFADLNEHFDKALVGEPRKYQRMVTLGNGEQRWIEAKLVPHVPEQDQQVPGFYAMAVDITEQRAAAERIQHLANHDSLTGLPNRLLFNERLELEIDLARREHYRFALLFLDLDRFKAVNDTFGHHAGDLILQIAAKRIVSQLRASDTVARMGGDEFTIILRDIGELDHVRAIADKIIAALASPFHLQQQDTEIGIGSSIGIAIYPDDAQEDDTLIKLADTAMYEAKARGNCFCIYRK